MSDDKAPNRPTDNSPPTVWFISGDLVFASRVQAAAKAANLPFQLSMHPPAVETMAEGCRVGWVILDLSTRAGIVESLRETCRRVCPDAVVLAYGPHVQASRLSAARRAGIETVLTRGQFNAELPTLFQS